MDAGKIKVLAGTYGVSPNTIQKDYAITLLLEIVSEFDKISSLAFKGGTALKKMYYPETRFSVDLDFTCTEDISAEISDAIKERIQVDMGVDFTDVKELDAGKFSRKYSVKYLDYNSHPDSVKIDLSLREKTVQEVKNLKVIHSYNVKNRDFAIPTMNITEIMAEKVRAILHAQKPRHLHDMWYLIGKNIRLDPNLVSSKLKLYGEEFHLGKFRDAILEMEDDWEGDLNPLLQTVPPFGDVSHNVMENVTKAMK